MLYSNLFFYNNHFERDNSKLDLVQLMEKSCIFSQDNAGVYSILGLGVNLEKKLISLIEDEMSDIGFNQIRLSLLQDAKLWEKSKRIDSYGDELFKLKNRKNQSFCLSATGEELITSIYQKYYQYQKANCNVFQIGNKYRDEMRARAGLVRGKEFIMKDGYSFSSSKEDLVLTYEKVRNSYISIFKKLGLDFEIKKTDNGEMGGDFSEEFLVKSSLSDSDDGMVEVAHIFYLGDTYSKHFELLDDNKQYVQMACYGIGISRLLMLMLEKQRDSFGFFGTDYFNTYDYVICAVDYQKNDGVKNKSLEIYNDLKTKGYKVLLDDRKISAGKMFSDAELIACRFRIIVSKQNIEKGQIEFLDRKSMEKTIKVF